MNIMQVNAALWSLVERRDIESSAMIVIEFGHAIKEQAPFVFSGSISGENKSTFTGHTEHGDVTVKEGHGNERKFSFGENFTRVGHFKLYRRYKNEIWFHHFWKSEEVTGVEESTVNIYRIKFDAKTLQLRRFGIARNVPLLSLGVIHFMIEVIDPIWDSKREWKHISLIIGSKD